MNKEEYEKELKKIKVAIKKNENKNKNYIRLKKTFIFEILNIKDVATNILEDLKTIYSKYNNDSAVINEHNNLYIEYRKENKISSKPVLVIKWVERIFVINNSEVLIFPNSIDEKRLVIILKKTNSKEYDLILREYGYFNDKFVISEDEMDLKKILDYRRSLYDTREAIRILNTTYKEKYYNQTFNKV